MDALIYVANGLFLLSYAVRDMLHLRVLAALAALCLVAYFATRPEPLVEAVFWNALFALLTDPKAGKASFSGSLPGQPQGARSQEWRPPFQERATPRMARQRPARRERQRSPSAALHSLDMGVAMPARMRLADGLL